MKKKLASCPAIINEKGEILSMNTTNYDQAVSYLIGTYGVGEIDYQALINDIAKMNAFFAPDSSLSVASLLVANDGNLASYDADTVWNAKRQLADWDKIWLSIKHKQTVMVFQNVQAEKDYVKAFCYSQVDLAAMVESFKLAAQAEENNKVEEARKYIEELVSLTLAGKLTDEVAAKMASLVINNNPTDANGNRSFISSAIVTPLWHQDQCLGALLMGYRETNSFSVSSNKAPHFKKVKDFVDFAAILATTIFRT